MTGAIRVLLVDDQDLIRTGFRLLLLGEADISVVGEARDGRGALDLLADLKGECDVVLMDVRMPRMNGIEATERIVAEYPDMRVLVLTTFDLDEYAQAAIRAGASGFLLKDARPTELVDAIQRVFAGDAVMAPSMMKRMIEQMRRTGNLDVSTPISDGVLAPNSSAGGASGVSGTHLEGRIENIGGAEAGSPIVNPEDSLRKAGPGLATAGSPAPEATATQCSKRLSVLTEREREVLRLIAEGLNNAEISAHLFLSESTVKTHVGRILFKLELRDRIHAVILAKELGL